MEKPICEKCKENNKKYSVTQGACSTTCMAVSPPYWDENGVYHPYNNPKAVSCSYTCSNGHNWNIEREITNELEKQIDKQIGNYLSRAEKIDDKFFVERKGMCVGRVLEIAKMLQIETVDWDLNKD